MITWLQYWIFLPMPTVILAAMASMPTISISGRWVGGGPVREFYLNSFALPVLPADAGARLVEWFSTASLVQEWSFALAVAINVNALLLPLLYFIGKAVIGFSSWSARKNIELLRKATK